MQKVTMTMMVLIGMAMFAVSIGSFASFFDGMKEKVSDATYIEGEALCGNGVLEETEECDDGNAMNNDGCTTTCLVEPSCGGGLQRQKKSENVFTNSGKYKEHPAFGQIGCTSGIFMDSENEDLWEWTCIKASTQAKTCRVEKCLPGDECDDGNWSLCGDGIVESGEMCDDGNDVDGDGCSSSCDIEFCGDGFLDEDGGDNESGTEDDEECDDGNRNDGDGCSSDCRIEK